MKEKLIIIKAICYNCDNATEGSKYCSKQCWVEDALPAMIERSGMNQGIYKYFTFEKFIFDSDEEKALEKRIRKYLLNDIEKGFFIYGSVGVGKTHLVFAIVRELMKILELEAKVFNVPRMIADYKESNFDNRIVMKAETVSIAIFDDLGSEFRSQMSTELLTRIIDKRLIENRLTFITSNLTPKMIGEMLDLRLISRIKALTHSIEMKGQDRRNE